MIRPSTEARIERAGAVLIRLIVGLVLMVAGFGFDLFEYLKPPTHTTHLIMWTALALLGVLVAAGRYVFPVLRQAVVIIGPYIPVVGGRRAGDPPAQPKDDAP